MGQAQRAGRVSGRGRARLTPEERQELAEESLRRARDGSSVANDLLVIEAFAERGIYDARPRENVFTFWGWKALGRSVKKGEHAVRVPVIIRTPGEVDPQADPSDPNPPRAHGRSMRRNAFVFHVSQTQESGPGGYPVKRSADTVEALALALALGSGETPDLDGDDS